MIGMTPTYWLVLGVALIITEVTVPGLVVVFFGLSALVVALLTLLIPSLSNEAAWLLFAVFSVVFLLTLRRWVRKVFTGKRSQVQDELRNDIAGRTAVVVVRIQPGQPGKVEFHGTNWQAVSSETLEPGVQVRIVKQDSITLTVERM
jgi:membrane protein implicated in regulation of membrane protease activity